MLNSLRKNSLSRKLIITYFILIILSLSLLFFISLNSFTSGYQQEINHHLEYTSKTLRLIIKDFPNNNILLENKIKELGKTINARITIVDSTGVVLADSENNPLSMENHNTRPEIIQARKKGIGHIIRFSQTLSMDMLYLAVPMDQNNLSGKIIRIALPLKQVSLVTRHTFWTLGITFIGLTIIALIMGFWIVNRIVQPINKMTETALAISHGDFSQHIQAESNDEIGTLAKAINKMNRELQKLFSETAKYEQLRRDFVANASHELRTPLSMIKGYVETLREGTENDQQKMQEFIHIIDRNVSQLNNLVEDLLELSHLEYQKSIPQPKPVNIRGIIKEILEYLTPASILKKQEIINKIEADTSEINTDPELLKKAITNLLDNAIKYTPEGGKIEVITKTQDNNLFVTVKDNGIGIPAEDLPRIFERFYRVDKSRSREMGGTGLGLAIVKHIIQTLGGEVTVQSETNKGSTFTIKLPV